MVWLIFAAMLVLLVMVRLPLAKAATIADALTLAFPVSVQVLPLTVMFVNVGPFWPVDSTVSVCEKPTLTMQIVKKDNKIRNCINFEN
jgi:hypothetical protein